MEKMALGKFQELYGEAKAHPMNVLHNVSEKGRELQAGFESSLVEQGLIQPIIIVDEKIYDGVRRCKALKKLLDNGLIKASYEVKIEDWSDRNDLKIMSTSLHLYYKDLSKSQRAAIAVKIWLPELSEAAEKRMKHINIIETINKKKKTTQEQVSQTGTAASIAGKIVGCSDRLVNAAKKGIDKIPSTYEWIMKGQMTAKDAENLALFSSEEGKEIIMKGLEKGKSYGAAKQAWLHRVNAKHEYELEEKNMLGDNEKVDMDQIFEKQMKNKDRQEGNSLRSYKRELLKPCLPEDAKKVELILTVSQKLSFQTREALAHVLCENGYCKKETAIKAGKDYFLIKAQPTFTAYAEKNICLPEAS